MEIEESLLVVGLCLVSAITQEPNENPNTFLGRLKRVPPKVYQSGLRLLQGTGDFKGQIPVLMCIRYVSHHSSLNLITFLIGKVSF